MSDAVAQFTAIPLISLVPALLVLVSAAVAHTLLRWWMRRRARAAEQAIAHGEDARGWLPAWLSRGLLPLVPPAALLVWVHATWAAGRVVMAQLPEGSVETSGTRALDWAYGLGVLLGLVWLLSRLGHLVEAFLRSRSARSEATWDDVLYPVAGRAARQILPLLALILGAPALEVAPDLEQLFQNGASLVLIAVVAILLYQLVDAAAAFLLHQHRLDTADNLQARAVHTQVMVLKKVAVTIIGIFALASMLMVFESVRQFGASILASAGIAGIIIGFAAQRSIATLLAGFQIAITQPIRVDDVVIVENEWGRIEDITLTYVVVRIWDLRRLVLPITYFIERPFQNWTRTSADILGTVFLRVDYSVPLERLRTELTRVLTSSPHWDGKVNGLQVTDAGERTLEVRALMSAADASKAWDLRCEVREKLVTFLQEQYPESLPRLRATVDAPVLAEAGGER